MTLTPSCPQRAAALAVWLLASAASGQTLQDFDAAGSPYDLGQHGGAPGASVMGGGPTGNFLRLVPSTTGTFNSIDFERTDRGAFCDFTVDFDFRITPGVGSAEGLGMALLDTAVHDEDGVVASAEEPDVTGSLGVGFDVAASGGGDLNDNHVSIHFDGARIAQVDATAVVDLDGTAGQMIHAQLQIHADDVSADVTVVLTAPGGSPTTLVSALAVPGMQPYEGRLHLGARTGGSSGATHDVDNLSVTYGGCPAVLGSWGDVIPLPIIAIHDAMLPTGEVIFWDRDDQLAAPPYLFDPETETLTAASDPGYNLFCSGHSFLPNGNLFVTGGHTIGDGFGLDLAHIYDPVADTWTVASEAMNAGRWYPNQTTLANGDQLVLSGSSEPGVVNTLPQVYQVATDDFRDLSTAVLGLPLYPLSHLAPDGRAFVYGPAPLSRFLDTSGTGSWTNLGNTATGINRSTGTGAIYDRGQVLLAGGGDPPTATAEVIDLYETSPAWRTVTSMNYVRRQLNSVILADGSVLVTGGTREVGFNSSVGSVFAAERWDPQTETWTTLAGAQIPRIYHSFSLLLPDGRVMTGGGGHPPGAGGGSNHFDAEIYSPAYLFQGARPVIDSVPVQIGRGGAFLVETPDANTIDRVHLIRLSSVTHSFNHTQSINRLDFVETSAGLVVEEPVADTLAPAGPYMLFLIDQNGVPSGSELVYVVEAPTPESICDDGLDGDGDGLADCFDRDCLGTAACPGATVLQSDFDAGPDGWVYVDDAFRATAEPAYASGAHQPGGGFSGGGLEVTLGGVDGADIVGMSGAWRRDIVLAAAGEVEVSFRYDLTQSAEYESDELSQVMLTLEAAPFGVGAMDYVAQIVGDGGGGSPIGTGWTQFSVHVGPLAAGSYRLEIGGFNSEKTSADEITSVALDDVTISFFDTPTCGDGSVSGAEQCDGGDCCTGACTFETAGTGCTDDGEFCTDDVCDAAGLCTHPSGPMEGLGCDDSDACTEGDTCTAGTCQPSGPVSCDDGDACTADSCDPISGCAFTPIFECCGDGIVEGAEECDDANPTGGDGCSATCSIEPGWTCQGAPSACVNTAVPIGPWVVPVLMLLLAAVIPWVERRRA